MSKGGAYAASPHVIDEANLSLAWVRVIDWIQSHPGSNISPLVVSFHGFDPAGLPIEDEGVRQDLNALLKVKGQLDIERVAFTIFPERIWKIAGGDRQKLFDYYKRAFPRYQAMNRQLNGRGLYFERLTMFGSEESSGNQLEFIIGQYKSRTGVRDSMLQASIFDPVRDHTTSAQLGFPCLQHVTFVPTREGLVTNAFYATQQLFNKAYGNYLGLARLCAFMAREMLLQPVRINVFIGVAKLDRIAKSDPGLVALVKAAMGRVEAVA
jgi:hypothetical protein